MAPLQVEVFELSAGGVSEKRDDWTTTVRSLATEAVRTQTGYGSPPAVGDEAMAEIAGELSEVTALVQVISMNHIVHGMAPGTLSTANKTLNYNVGPIDKVLDALKTEGLLVVFVRDEYSTGGRKALMALGILAGAATGVVIVPRGGITINCAALVARDGTILWFNYAGSAGDMRTREGAEDTIARLLEGLPTIKPAVASLGE